MLRSILGALFQPPPTCLGSQALNQEDCPINQACSMSGSGEKKEQSSGLLTAAGVVAAVAAVGVGAYVWHSYTKTQQVEDADEIEVEEEEIEQPEPVPAPTKPVSCVT